MIDNVSKKKVEEKKYPEEDAPNILGEETQFGEDDRDIAEDAVLNIPKAETKSKETSLGTLVSNSYFDRGY